MARGLRGWVGGAIHLPLCNKAPAAGHGAKLTLNLRYPPLRCWWGAGIPELSGGRGCPWSDSALLQLAQPRQGQEAFTGQGAGGGGHTWAETRGLWGEQPWWSASVRVPAEELDFRAASRGADAGGRVAFTSEEPRDEAPGTRSQLGSRWGLPGGGWVLFFYPDGKLFEK